MAESVAPSEQYKVIRGQIEHINNSLSQRVIWLVIAQSFFFSGYAILVTGNPNLPMMVGKQHLLLLVFPISSMLAIVLSYVDILGSLMTLRKLRRSYEVHMHGTEEDKLYPPISSWNGLRLMEHTSPALLPLTFIIIWLYILYT